MPRISQAQRDARRQQILEAALRCFSRDGFHATTTADIVKESGVSQGTLYLYFANKDDIVVALGDDRHQHEAFLNAVAQSEPDPIQGLLSLIELHGKGLLDARHADMRRVGVQGWGEALRNPRIHASAIQGVTTVREAIIRLIEDGKRSGQIRPNVDAEAFARVLIAAFQGLLLQITWGETVDLAACGQVIRDMIEGSLLTPTGRATWKNSSVPPSSNPAC